MVKIRDTGGVRFFIEVRQGVFSGVQGKSRWWGGVAEPPKTGVWGGAPESVVLPVW